MKIAIVSDTHDNLATIEKAVNWMNKNGIEEIIHCGDVCSEQTLQWFAESFPGTIHLALGNADENRHKIPSVSAAHANIILHGESGKVRINSKKIAFTHFPEIARALALGDKYDFVFYGHTHRPWEEKVGACRLINPGNLANLLFKASFAVYDAKNNKLELKILENI